MDSSFSTESLLASFGRQEEFLRSLDSLQGVNSLFDNFPNLYFWIKDKSGCFMMANQPMIEKCGKSKLEDVIGKTDYDFFPKDMATKYCEDDLKVLETQEKIINRIEAIPNEDGSISWYSTNKVPVYNREKHVVGVAGTTRSLNKAVSANSYYMDMTEVLDYISKNYHKNIEVKQLAEMSALSISQFERRFKETFQDTPMKFIIKTRIKAACHMLTTTQKPISWIAMSTGFYDHSSFAKQFFKHLKMKPGEYREQFYKGDFP